MKFVGWGGHMARDTARVQQVESLDGGLANASPRGINTLRGWGATLPTLWQSVRKRKELGRARFQRYNDCMAETKSIRAVLIRLPSDVVVRLDRYRRRDESAEIIRPRTAVILAAVEEFLKKREQGA